MRIKEAKAISERVKIVLAGSDFGLLGCRIEKVKRVAVSRKTGQDRCGLSRGRGRGYCLARDAGRRRRSIHRYCRGGRVKGYIFWAGHDDVKAKILRRARKNVCKD